MHLHTRLVHRQVLQRTLERLVVEGLQRAVLVGGQQQHVALAAIGSHRHRTLDESVAIPGFRVQLVHRVADQPGWPLVLVEEQQRRVDHLAIGETADAQAVDPLGARQPDRRVEAPAHGKVEARREAVQLLVARFVGIQFGEVALGDLLAAAPLQVLVEIVDGHLGALEQSLQRIALLAGAIQAGQRRRTLLELDLPALGEGDLRRRRGLPLEARRALLGRDLRVVHAALLVHPGVVGTAVLAANETLALEGLGIDVFGGVLAVGQDVVGALAGDLGAGIEAVLHVAVGIDPGVVATLALPSAAVPRPLRGVVRLVQHPRLVALADALPCLALLAVELAVDEGVVHPAIVVHPGQVAPAGGPARRRCRQRQGEDAKYDGCAHHAPALRRSYGRSWRKYRPSPWCPRPVPRRGCTPGCRARCSSGCSWYRP